MRADGTRYRTQASLEYKSPCAIYWRLASLTVNKPEHVFDNLELHFDNCESA
jgi:hypothetical protein